MRTAVRRAAGAIIVCACVLLSLPANAATPLDLDTLHGRVVYLDFWASWCVPCRQSFPWMQAMKAAYERQGLTIVAINLDQDHDSAARFIQQFRPGFEVRFDPEGTLAGQYKVAGMPTSVIIDRHGVVRFTHIGFRTADRAAYEQQLRELLADH